RSSALRAMESQDSKQIEKAKELAAGPLGVQLSRIPLLFAKAVILGARPSRKGNSRINTGTITFLDLGKKPIAITCAHVLSKYRRMLEENPNVIFQVGDLVLDPLAQLIAVDAHLDLASIELTREQVNAIEADGEIGSCVLEPPYWPSPILKPGDFVAFGGFPGSLRKRPAHDEVVFGSWSSGAASVTTVYENGFSCQFERQYWVCAFGARDQMELKDLGGMSGGPAFIQRGLHFDLVGIIREFSPSFDILFF